MADDDNVSGTPDGGERPTESTAPVVPPDVPEPAPQPVLKTRWRDRAWSFRDMIAVGLATLVLGGVAGGAIVAASDDDHDGRGHFMIRPGGPGNRMPPGMGRHFRDGGPQWRWNDREPMDPPLTPSGTPKPVPTP